MKKISKKTMAKVKGGAKPVKRANVVLIGKT